MSDTIQATLVIELNVECPECEHDFNLFEQPENDEGRLYRQVIDDDRWKIAPEDRLKTHAHCPECSAEFVVKGVLW